MIDHRSYTCTVHTAYEVVKLKPEGKAGFDLLSSQGNQLPEGLIAQLVEHCTGIAEAMGSYPVQAWIFIML